MLDIGSDQIWQMLEHWSRECHEEGQDVCHEDIRHPYHKSAGQERENTFSLIFVIKLRFTFYKLDGQHHFMQLIRGLFMFLCLITAMRISITSQRFCKSLGVEADSSA